MTKRGDDAAERDNLIAALIRTLCGEARSGSGRISAKAIAEEAGLARTALTHKHEDINDLIRLVKALDKKARDNGSDEASNLRTENAELKTLVDTLAAQVTLATMRLQDLKPTQPRLTAVPPAE
ncbi:hypothetical protein [Brevibacterium litoralis]|uniref:hypothetical protein n=1 Tax=Brevibacterium litoralis TaxID=3138935 RepID=UPI0032EAF4A9